MTILVGINNVHVGMDNYKNKKTHILPIVSYPVMTYNLIVAGKVIT